MLYTLLSYISKSNFPLVSLFVILYIFLFSLEQVLRGLGEGGGRKVVNGDTRGDGVNEGGGGGAEGWAMRYPVYDTTQIHRNHITCIIYLNIEIRETSYNITM